MLIKRLIVLFLLSSFCLPVIGYAQNFEIGANAGGAGYMGDLNPDHPLKISGINAGFFARYNFDPHWGLGLHYNYGVIKANDAESKNQAFRDRNLSFRSPLSEISFIGNFNFIDIYSPISKKRISPYIYAGIGGVIFEPMGYYSNKWIVPLRESDTENVGKMYRKYAISIPYGAGVKYRKSEYFTVFAQLGYRTTTDNLDDVRGVYPSQDKLWGGLNISDRSIEATGNKIFNPGDQRGDFRKRDTYLFASIGITYTFVSQKCF